MGKRKLDAPIRTLRMEGVHVSGGAISPTGARPGTAGSNYKRKRSGAEFESSPGSGGEVEDDEEHRRRQPGVKRACNECRQQKVSHIIIIAMKIATARSQDFELAWRLPC